MSRLPSRVLFGAAYYHEYQPSDRLKVDLDLMSEASFSVIRVGESVWSTWEPENDRFDLEWLRPVLDGAHERGIAVILGTPTYAVPPWLVRLYPEIAGQRSTGQPIPWGARQEVDFTHAAFRFHAERVVRAILSTYADHPAVIGFQVDNEPGLELLHNNGVFQRFVDDLRHRYGDVETLNERWGLVYWSHRLSTWADLWRPDGNVQPQYDVAWREFQARQTTEFIAWQAGIVREYAAEHQFVTTCLAYDRPALDESRITDSLDVTSANAYYRMQDGLLLPDDRTYRQHWTSTGVWALNLSADRMFASRQSPFLVTETNASSIGRPWDNEPAYDGQWRQAAWALIARGAQMIEYWHWHTLHFGAETYWGGVLPHSGRPGRTYRELAALGAELARAGGVVTGLEPDADVVMLYSSESKWLMEKYPPLADDAGLPDGRAYHTIFDAFYRGAFDAGRQTRIVHVRQLFEGMRPGGQPVAGGDFAADHPVLIAVGLYLCDDRTIEWLLDYARAGGHLVLGPRTGYADEDGRARSDVMPARLHDAAGISYDEFSNIAGQIAVRSAEPNVLALSDESAATRWIDGLQLDGATALATYDHPHFGRWPAVTTTEFGTGRITYVGTVPGQQLARQLLRWLDPKEPLWSSLPDTVTVRTATNHAGERIHVVHNWSWDGVGVIAPRLLHDVLSDEAIARDATVSLGPWDVRIFVERFR